ncbi:zinc-binding dehydrogenase, partial [Chloroflexota bacterium]
MKAWRLHAYGDLRLDEVPLPEIKPGWVLVKVKVVQVAVVEAGHVEGMPHLFQAGLDKMLSEGKPVQLGHEYCGEVVEIGQGVTTLKVGDRVSSENPIPCGTCRMCREGKVSQCLSHIAVGRDIPGAYAEYVCLPEYGLTKIPDGPTDNEVAAFQPLSACASHVRNAEIQMGDTVVVLGQGPMGLGALQIARLAGAGLLIGVDIRPETLDLSRDFGANIVINSSEVDVVKEVKRLTDDVGADVVFEEAGGRPKDGLAGFQTIEQAIQMVRVGGKIIQGANLVGMMEVDSVFLKIRSIKYIHPSRAIGTEALQHAAFLVASGRMKVGPQISHVLHGLEKVPEALEITVNKAKYRATNP